MANIHIRRNKNVNERTGNVTDNVDAGTNAGNATDRNDGREDTVQPNNNDIGSTDNDNIPGEPVAGNSTKHSFNASDYEYVNPTSATGNTDTGTPKRRGRKAGYRRVNKAGDTQTTQDLKSLLLTVHFGLAGLLHAPKLKLSETEAESLSTAIKRVTDLYDVRIIPEKQMAWLNLMITAGCIYVPRLRKDKSNDKEQGTANANSNARVVQMPVTQPVSSGVQ